MTFLPESSKTARRRAVVSSSRMVWKGRPDSGWRSFAQTPSLLVKPAAAQVKSDAIIHGRRLAITSTLQPTHGGKLVRCDPCSLRRGQETPHHQMLRLVTCEVKTCKSAPSLTGTRRGRVCRDRGHARP